MFVYTERLKWIFDHKFFALAEYLEKALDKQTKRTYVIIFILISGERTIVFLFLV